MKQTNSRKQLLLVGVTSSAAAMHTACFGQLETSALQVAIVTAGVQLSHAMLCYVQQGS
jgi:hypothetical protein